MNALSVSLALGLTTLQHTADNITARAFAYDYAFNSMEPHELEDDYDIEGERPVATNVDMSVPSPRLPVSPSPRPLPIDPSPRVGVGVGVGVGVVCGCGCGMKDRSRPTSICQ